MHGSSWVASTGPSLKRGWPPCFIGLGCLILCISTGHTNTKTYFTLVRFSKWKSDQTTEYKTELLLMIFLDKFAPGTTGTEMTPAELWNHPGDNLLLTTNSVTPVLNQHYCQCLSNWVMFKHTQRRKNYLATAVCWRRVPVRYHCKYLCVHVWVFFCMYKEWYCTSKWGYLCCYVQTHDTETNIWLYSCGL